MDCCWASTHIQQTPLVNTVGSDGSEHQFNEAYNSRYQWLSQGAKLSIHFKRYYILKRTFILLRWIFCNCIVILFSVSSYFHLAAILKLYLLTKLWQPEKSRKIYQNQQTLGGTGRVGRSDTHMSKYKQSVWFSFFCHQNHCGYLCWLFVVDLC